MKPSQNSSRPSGRVFVKTPLDTAIEVAATPADDFAYFTIDQADDIRRYYAEYGYVVIRNLIPAEVCRIARQEYEREVKPYKGFIYRQATANPERHVYCEHGFMMNPILNVQSMDPRHFPEFRRLGVAVITHANLQQAVSELFGEAGKLVQSMYFEGNPATWPHQDTYYLDAEQIGRMTAAWVSVEQIAAGAGRFFIYPKSHLLDLEKNGGDVDIAFNHARYKKRVVEIIDSSGLECRAPALGEGDVLLWAAKTIHGSLQTTQPEASRSSFTAHFIPRSSRFLQLQSRIKPLNLETIGGIDVHKPKDLANVRNRGVLWVETTFPQTFQSVKKAAVKWLTG
jgi:phytanoyl-CoA hydroxylase